MNKRLVFLTPLAIALGLGLILFTAIGKDPTKLETARLNDAIPAFKLSSLLDKSKYFTQLDIQVIKESLFLFNKSIIFISFLLIA